MITTDQDNTIKKILNKMKGRKVNPLSDTAFYLEFAIAVLEQIPDLGLEQEGDIDEIIDNLTEIATEIPE